MPHGLLAGLYMSCNVVVLGMLGHGARSLLTMDKRLGVNSGGIRARAIPGQAMQQNTLLQVLHCTCADAQHTSVAN